MPINAVQQSPNVLKLRPRTAVLAYYIAFVAFNAFAYLFKVQNVLTTSGLWWGTTSPHCLHSYQRQQPEQSYCPVAGLRNGSFL